MRETVGALLLDARKALVAADIEPAGLDARLLLQAASGLSHEEIVADHDVVVTDEVCEQFKKFIHRRLGEEPVSRILGAREFYGRMFEVTPAVLDPRADTEALIALVLDSKKGESGRLLDIGTGSGAIAISLLCELPGFSGVAVDISAVGLHVARKNALANGVSGRLHFHLGSWFQGLAERFDLIVSNPPYIPHGEIATLGNEVKNYDPHLALDGGADGLFAYRAIAADAALHLNPDGLVVVEIGAGQKDDVKAIFEERDFDLSAHKSDLGGHVRALVFQLNGDGTKKPL